MILSPEVSMNQGDAAKSGDEGQLRQSTTRLVQQKQTLTRAARDIIATIPDANCHDLQGTPPRFARAFADFTNGYSRLIDREVGDAILGEAHNHVVVVRYIPVYSLCEHHLLPFFGQAHVAYKPDPKVGIIGFSKFNLLVDICARRLHVQERLTSQIMDEICRLVKPLGVGVVLDCRHMCMEMRGVESPCVSTITKKTCGVFDDAATFAEFCSTIRHGERNEQESDARSGCEPNMSSSCSDSKPIFREGAQSDSCDYQLYQRCAKNESSSIATVIQEAVKGPLCRAKHGTLSICDIGAGNGRVLEALCRATGPLKTIAHYTAFEMDSNLCKELRVTAHRLGLHQGNCLIKMDPFTLDTGVEDAGGRADIVLLSHSLYGSENKEELVEHALQFVAPGGVMFIIHRWVTGGTLDAIRNCLTSKAIIHQFRIWDIDMDLENLDTNERLRLCQYTKGDVTMEQKQNSASRTIACIAVEPHSVRLDRTETTLTSIIEAQGRVGYLARRKTPAAVVKPNTVVGVQACLRAASLQLVGSGRVTVIGGGHSENAFADNAIAIDMQLWDHVDVDAHNMVVRVGGGIQIGAITEECAKHSLMIPLGDRPGVGAGLILQGGLNHFMRRYGLATDNIVRVIYVSPTGQLNEASSDEELFPFRGAGTNFGVVLEVTLRAFPLAKVLAQDAQYIFKDIAGSHVATIYSQIASSSSETACLDGYIFWSSQNQLSFATSYYDTQASDGGGDNNLCIALPIEESHKLIRGESSIYSPAELCDRELYMTPSFAPERVLGPGQSPPDKIRSKKRCLLLPKFLSVHESILLTAMSKPPTKWSYIHFLHGGKAVSRVPQEKTAFGCRDWSFAAVITARWPDGDTRLENAATGWLEHTTNALLTHSRGVYGSDLGPEDSQLARRAFGKNSLRLATMKRQVDPLNILGCACPLLGDNNDPHHVQDRGVVVVFCGRRCAGKDWLAQIAEKMLKQLCGGCDDGTCVSTASISDETKQAYAKDNPSIDAEKLKISRDYKEKHRQGLSDFYQKKRAEDVSYDATCYLSVIQRSKVGILLLTGMRDGLHYARSLAGRAVVLVRVKASDEAKQARGWTYNELIDMSEGECAADVVNNSFWDLCFENNLESTTTVAEAWVKHTLAPCILKTCTRHLPDTPQPGIMYRDIIGSLLLQPFAMSLSTSLAVDWLEAKGVESVDAVAAPEALGFVFAGSIAARLNRPLILLRKEGKLPGDIDRVSYDGSNMHKLNKRETEACSLEISSGAINPGQRILVVDDCLASGSTLNAILRLVSLQGGTVTQLVCVMEFPDLMGREKVKVDTFSLMQFEGK